MTSPALPNRGRGAGTMEDGPAAKTVSGLSSRPSPWSIRVGTYKASYCKIKSWCRHQLLAKLH